MVNQPTAELLLSSRANLRPAFTLVAFHKLYRSPYIGGELLLRQTTHHPETFD
jgi:hypothetical protein